MMKLLVTGGAGFIGANFIHLVLRETEHQVVNLDALTYAGDLARLKEVESNPRYRFTQGSILDTALVDDLVLRSDATVHFAAESHVDRSITGPRAFLETNVTGTLVLLEAARKYGKRFHHVSTDEVYGALELDDEQKFNEQTAYDPRSPYSASKAGSDHLVRAYWHTYKLPVTITNCSNNYGPWQSPDRITPLFIHNAQSGQPLPIYGDGKAVRDYLYVKDHCRAILAVLERGQLGETYCVGGGAEMNGIEIADTILAATGQPDSLKQFVKDRPGHDRRYAIDASKIKAELGVQPTVSFAEGIAKTVAWFQDHQGWAEQMSTRMAEFKKGFHS